MPLSFTGDANQTGSSWVLLAYDQNGNRIVTHASHEVVHDRGLIAVQHKASEKFDAGLHKRGIVVVLSADFS